MNKSIDLTGQIALVTGGGRGIGRRIAEDLAEAGAAVAIAARTAAQLGETVAAITSKGGKCIAYELDVTDVNDVHRIVARVYDELGPIDLLVNNAGIGGDGSVSWQIDPDEWWRILEVNVRGAFNCTNAVLKSMVDKDQGRIINIGSYAGVLASPMASAYGASKAALLHFSNSIGVELAEMNVKIFTISPGLVLTEMTKDVPVFQDLPDSAWTPIERSGEVCVLLAGGAADQLSGRFIHVSDDDMDSLIENADVIVDQDLQVLRLQRFADL